MAFLFAELIIRFKSQTSDYTPSPSTHDRLTHPLKLSILDQSPISSGKTAHDAVQATIELAQAADRWGYTRYWLAEHHSSNSLADASPEILLAALATQTKNIRIGSGGC